MGKSSPCGCTDCLWDISALLRPQSRRAGDLLLQQEQEKEPKEYRYIQISPCNFCPPAEPENTQTIRNGFFSLRHPKLHRTGCQMWQHLGFL